ncbi:MAG TPA: helix-turn-helix domain-containing protein, partial [bacterium]|nr:helix-turn-helix domain-containing protein [bacterium]
WYDGGITSLREGNSIIESIMPSKKLTNVSRNVLPISKYGNSFLPHSAVQQIANDLEKIMETEKLYLENDIKLEILAQKLNVSKHHISQTINRVYVVNFFDYINKKRIEEAKRILHNYEKKDLNVLEVAFMVGYNHKGTFNSVFKKMTGTTPTEYRKQIQSSPSLN